MVQYQYDSLNHLTDVLDSLGHYITLQYDIGGRSTTVVRDNGTTRGLAYDDANHLTGISEVGRGNSLIASWTITPDAVGRTSAEAVSPTLVNRLEPGRSMTVDADNRLATFQGKTVSYDTHGNLTGGPLTLLGGFVNLTYDVRDRLTATGPQGVTPAVGYRYDSEGRRTIVTNGASIAIYVVNPVSALAEPLVRTIGGASTYYIYGPGVGLLYQIDSANQIEYYHADPRGSTAAMTDSSGNVTDRMEYSPYGGLTHRSGTTDTPFLYNGRFGVMTDANGLLFMRSRYYSPLLSRFLNADPSGVAGGLNLYAFADGNPINLMDPFGLCPDQPWYNQAASWVNQQVSTAQNFYNNNLPWQAAGALNSAISIVGGVANTPQAIGDFGTGAGTFAGDPSWANAGGLASDVSLAAGATAGLASLGTAAVESEIGEWQVVNESMSPRAAAYQSQITGAPSGWAYNVNGVSFDGISGGTLLDAKGPGYANFVNNGEFQPWFSGQQSLLNQARSQIGAAGGDPIQWHIAEGEALPAFQNLFQLNGISGIQLIHTPVIP